MKKLGNRGGLDRFAYLREGLIASAATFHGCLGQDNGIEVTGDYSVEACGNVATNIDELQI